MALEQSAAGGKELLAGKPQRALYFWALNRAMPANLSKISTGVNSKRTSIIREESQKKKKGKEDVCSVLCAMLQLDIKVQETTHSYRV